jgi:hypothetical protein
MKVMVMIQGSAVDESKTAPTQENLAAMSDYNERLVKAGIMLDGAGLKPSAEGAGVVFGTTSVVDGPFTEAKEIIAGYLGLAGDPRGRDCPINPRALCQSALRGS